MSGRVLLPLFHTDLRPVLEGEAHILLRENRHMVEKVEPKVIREFLYILIHLCQVMKERLDHFPLCLTLHDPAADLIQPFLCPVIAFGESIILLLVILLILCNMGVLADALLDQFR